MGCGVPALNILFPSHALHTAQGEVKAAKTLATKDPAMVLWGSPRERGASACAQEGLSRTEGDAGVVSRPLHTHAHTHACVSALTCQCGGPSGPALSTRGAVCGRGQSRAGSAWGQRGREHRSCGTLGRPVRGGRTE